MTCENCTKAATRRWHGTTQGCQACAARHVARGPLFAEAKRLRVQGKQYRQQLQDFGVTHADVMKAHQAEQERA